MQLVSILIPAYNAERWIGATINSALQQTWAKKEIIVVDDGSTDRTIQVARQFASKSVKVLTQDNRGACAARNKALESAQGEYIQWLDADDLLAPEKISLQMERRETERDERILYTSAWGQFFFQPERARFQPDELWRDLNPVDWLVTKFEKGVWMNPTVWLVSRTLTEEAGPWDERCSSDDDGEYVCRLVAKSVSVSFVQEATCYYRIGNVSALSWNWRQPAKLDSLAFSTSLCINHLRSLEDSERTRAACLKLLQARVPYYYRTRPTLITAAESQARDLGGSLRPPLVSRKFRLVSGIAGWESAMKLKNRLWTTEVFCRQKWERLRDITGSLCETVVAGHRRADGKN